jgi:hypothetical protein
MNALIQTIESVHFKEIILVQNFSGTNVWSLSGGRT